MNYFAQIDIDPNTLDIPRSATPGSNDVSNILQLVFGIAGAIAVLVIVIAGIQFILSQGDPQKAGVARNAIIYAAIGLAIVVLAFSIVTFVVGKL